MSDFGHWTAFFLLVGLANCGGSGSGPASGTGGAMGGAIGTGGMVNTGGSVGTGGYVVHGPDPYEDCTDLPCPSLLVCCTADYNCHPADAGLCPNDVMVRCTKASDCPNGQSCCVTAASTVGSGPSGSECAPSCDGVPDSGVGKFQGIACDLSILGSGIADCPAPAGQWASCRPIPNTPAGLGLCTLATDAGN